MIVATPLSGYSHWAANALGPPTDCIVPVPGDGVDNLPLSDLTRVNLGRPADTSWL